MPNSSADTKVIIALLEADKAIRDDRMEKTDKDMADIKKDIHSIDLNVGNIRGYFIGIDPQNHIIHHVRMEEAAGMYKDIRKALWAAVISIGFTGIMAFMQWSAQHAQQDMQHQIAEIVKQQAKK